MGRQFKLIAQKMNPGRLEKAEVADTLRYLNTLRYSGPEFWINEEHPGPNGNSHPARKRGSDFLGIIPTIITPEMVGMKFGRFGAVEMKRDKDYDFIMKHYARLRDAPATNSKYKHYKDQIHFIEMVNRCGGVGMFAKSWQQVRDLFVQKGIDPGTMIYAGDKR